MENLSGGHSGLDDRVVDWCNLVWAEIATTLAGTGVESVETSYNAPLTSAADITPLLSAGTDTFYGLFRLNSTSLGSTDENYAHTDFEGPTLPQDILQIHAIYHASTEGTGFAETMGEAPGYAQQYRRRTVQDLLYGRDLLDAASTMASGNISKDVGYGVAGMIFSTSSIGGVDGYCMKIDVWPHPVGANSRLMLRYTQAPAKFATSELTMSCVYLAKYPDTFVNGVMSYVWLYLGDYSNYLKCYRTFVDGVAKIARMSQPQMSRQRLRGQAPGQPPTVGG